MRRHHVILAAALLVQGCAANGSSPLGALGGDRIAVSEASFDMSSVASTRLPRDRNQAMQQVLSGLVPMAEPATPDTAPERSRSAASRSLPASLQALVASPAPVVRAAPAGRVVSQPLPPAPRAAATAGGIDGIDVGLSPAMRRI